MEEIRSIEAAGEVDIARENWERILLYICPLKTYLPEIGQREAAGVVTTQVATASASVRPARRLLIGRPRH